MHELSVATELYGLCRRTVGVGDARLERVWIAVGELSAVEPDLLRFAWQAVTAGGADAGSRLEIEWRPARQLCDRCGEVSERAPGSWLRLCPQCQGPLRVEGGTELDLLRLAYVTEEEPAE